MLDEIIAGSKPSAVTRRLDRKADEAFQIADRRN
jgi:hypothetical protein